MNSSGMRRGLAVFAVSALAAVGLPLAASANPIEDQMDGVHTDREVTLYTPSTAVASTKNDGANTTISLTAGATSDIDSLRFQYSTDGVTWTNIGGPMTEPNDDGVYSREWTPGFTLPAAGIYVQAIGHSNIDDSQNTSASVSLNVNNTADTSALTAGSELGVYRSPIDVNDDTVIVTGTTSGGNTVVSLVDANGNDLYSTGNLANTAGAFRGILDIQGYTYNAPDEVMLRAVNQSGLTDDGEAYTLYQQVPTKITATANPANPANPATDVQVTITVLDQNDKPIAGAEVASETLVEETFIPRGETNANGQIVFNNEQSRNDGEVGYIVNQTPAQTTYDPGVGDIRVDLQVGQGYSADLAGASEDGPAFDFDEVTPGDFTVQVKDQTGANFDDPAAQDLTYFWKKIPFDGEPEAGASYTETGDLNGLYTVGFAQASDFPDNDLESGEYELWASLSEGGTGHPIASKKVLTVKAGEAAVEWVDPDGDGKTIAPAGTVATVQGNLVLEDGTGLPGRRVDLDYAKGTEYDEDGPTGNGDALLISDDPASTGANGAFTAEVEDISTLNNETEIGGDLWAGSATTPGLGDWNEGLNFGHGVDFVTDVVPDGAVLEIEYDADTAGPAGTRATGTVHLEDAFGDDIAGVQVELSLDTPETAQNGAFFVAPGWNSFLDPVAGNYVPTRDDSLGSTIIVSTDQFGEARFRTSIGRDSGFDDDGLTDAVVTAEVDGLSADDSVEWDTANPVNASEISIVRTPGQPENQRIDKGVLFDIYAKDQYGNPAKGVEVQAFCPEILGDDDTCSVDGLTTPSDLDNGGDLVVGSVDTDGDGIPDGVGEYTFTAEVAGGLANSTNSGNTTDYTEVYNDAGNPVKKAVTTEFTQSWYKGSIDDATYTLTTSPANKVKAGKPVTATLTAVDTEGNPLEGLRVEFVRVGDPDSEGVVFTDEDGVAEYVFEVEDACDTDTVTAVVRDTVTYDGDPNSGGKVIEKSTDVVSECKVKVGVNASNSENKKRDIIEVSASAPVDLTGAGVRLQKKVKGEWKTIGAKGKTLDSDGKARFSVKDANGNGKATKYRVIVLKTDETPRTVSGVIKRR